MKRTMRIGIVASLVLASASALAQSAADEQREAAATEAKVEQQPSTPASVKGDQAARAPAREAPPADPYAQATMPGAASGEPGEPTTAEQRDHQKWVESIWNSP
jgi:hypothetical protein